jgi:PAS domain S-box-containing protein
MLIAVAVLIALAAASMSALSGVRAYQLVIFLAILGAVMVIAAGLVYGREFNRTLTADAVLRESQEVLSLAMRGGRMGAFVCDLATNEVWWSRELEELFGLPEGGFPGTEAAFLELVHEQDRASFKQAIEGAIATGTDYAIEFRFRRGADTWRWMDGRGHVVYGTDGRPTRLVGIGIDITEHKQAEESARQFEARFHTMADAMPQLAMIARPDGWVDWYNRRWYEYTGMTPAATAGWGWASLHDPSVLPAVLERWRASIASGDAFEMVFPLRRADGAYRTFLARVNPLKDDAGRVLQWFGTGTDITVQQHAEETLRIADQRKDAFIATLAHELRNPLAPIRHALEIMRLPGTGAAELVTMRNIIDRQVRHLTRLVDDLLEVSRITRGNVQLRTERVALAGPLNDAVEAVQPLMKSSGHALTVELPSEPIELVCDPTRITQVVLNLLNNAAKFTPQGGQIRLSAKRVGNEAVIHVGDTGIGIPAANLSRIFEMFSQVSPPIERTRGGLGIGLALARGLVDLHGGDIQVSSAGADRGSEFTVRLPLSSTAEPSAGSPCAGEKVMWGGVRRKILVVDDNLDSAASLGRLLQLLGQEVHQAHDGVDAIDAADEFQPDVVLMDIGLPKLNGYDAGREIRLRAGSRALTIIAVTGWGQDEDKQRAAAAGFDGHFTKPIDATQLQAMLARIPPGYQAAAAVT